MSVRPTRPATITEPRMLICDRLTEVIYHRTKKTKNKKKSVLLPKAKAKHISAPCELR